MQRALALAVVVGVTFLRGQSPGNIPAQSGAETYKFSVHSDLVFLPTRVQTKEGKIIYGLKADQFMVDDNGERQRVEVDEEPEPIGLSLVVVVQCSRSAYLEFPRLKGLGAMIDAIGGAGPHEVALMSYGEAPYVLGDFTASPDAVRLAVSRIKRCGEYHAASIDAVYYAINMLRRRRTHYRKAILLISETRDHGSRSKLGEVVTELGINNVVIYSAAFSPIRDETVDAHDEDNEPFRVTRTPASASGEEPDPSYLDHQPRISWPPELLLAINALRRNAPSELASLSGGEYFNFATQRGFERGLDRIANEIHNYYLLRFQPPTSPIMLLHHLRVRVKYYPEARIQTRKTYWSGIYETSPGKAP